MTKFINWKCSNGYDAQYGQMPIQNVNKTLQQFEKVLKSIRRCMTVIILFMVLNIIMTIMI